MHCKEVCGCTHMAMQQDTCPRLLVRQNAAVWGDGLPYCR